MSSEPHPKIGLTYILSVFLLAACGTQGQDVSESAATAALTPYYSPTPTFVSGQPDSEESTPTPLPPPTPTPFVYQVQSGDTLLGIAARFGITLDDIRFANPGVDPRFLSIGTELIIPQPQESDNKPSGGDLPTPTPALSLSTQPECNDTATGGAVCLWQIHNPYEYDLEGISGVVRLYNQDGQQVASQHAILLLDVLPAGRSMPLLIDFYPPVAEWVEARGELITALEVAADSERYLETQVDIVDIEYDRDVAQVSGQVQLVDASQRAKQVWVAIIAYDVNGDPVGIRRWDAPNPLNGGDGLLFEEIVFSIGPAIDHIEVLVEARP